MLQKNKIGFTQKEIQDLPLNKEVTYKKTSNINHAYLQVEGLWLHFFLLLCLCIYTFLQFR